MTSVSDEILERRADLLVDAKDRLLEDLVSLRKEHKLSQQTVAERMGVSQPTVAAFERYDANPTVSSIIRYAMAVDALLDIKVVDDCGEGVPATWQKLCIRDSALGCLDRVTEPAHDRRGRGRVFRLRPRSVGVSLCGSPATRRGGRGPS